MFRIAVFFLLLFGVAAGLAWFADNPGTVTIQWPFLERWGMKSVTIGLLQVIIALAIIVAVAMMIWWVVSGVLHSPQIFGRWRAGRRRDKGYQALSGGLVAAGAGNANLARKLSKDAGRLLAEEPLVEMLDAQTLLLEGKRDEARSRFEGMLDKESTQVLGLRGLFIEAERQGEAEASAHFAREASKAAPGTPWAVQAVLRSQAMAGEWEAALKTLDQNRTSGLFEKEEFSRKKAVLLTAQAMAEEATEPEKAKAHALAAHKLEPSLAPAAVTAAQASSRLGDLRKAARILETCWKKAPHPEVAEAYINLRSGDSSLDRLKRAEALNLKRANHREGQMAVAQAAMDAGEWEKARKAMEAVFRNGASERACLLMAEIEETEHGDRGRVREWLARAVSAPRDPAWTADGIISEDWKPASPATGQIDAFEWKVPVEVLDDIKAIDYGDLAVEPLAPEMTISHAEEPETEEEKPGSTGETAAAGAAAIAATVMSADVSELRRDDVDDAEEIEVADDRAKPQETTSHATGTQDQTPDDNEQDDDTKVSDEERRAENDNATDGDGDPIQIAEPETAPETTMSETDGDENEDSRPSARQPYSNADLDADKDGVLDRRPDDPGIAADKEEPRKGLFF